MRILLINHFPLRGSGSGVYVKNIARDLVEDGHQVCIIMPENTTNIAKLENIKIHPVYFKKDESIEKQLNFNFPCMDIHPRSKFLFEEMTELQIEQYKEAFRKAIEEEIKKFNPDVIHSQHIWIVSSLLKDYSVPYIVTSHGAEFITYRKTNKFDKYGNIAVSGAKRIIAISNDNKKEIVDKFPEAESKLEFIKNGYSNKIFYKEEINKKEILERNSIKKDFNKIVIFVGRISEMKGIDTLLKAARIYEKEDVLTLIVGDGEYKTKLKALTEELQLKNIVFLGDKSQEELRKLYNISDVLVLPSRKEALPLVAIEALACGTPAIVTNQFGMTDIITEDVGFVFEMDNEKELAEKIKLILDKKVVFDKDKITKYAEENFSHRILMNKLIKIYEEIKK